MDCIDVVKDTGLDSNRVHYGDPSANRVIGTSTRSRQVCQRDITAQA